jgi:hypothetical protein
MYSGCKPKVQHLFSQTAKVHLLHMYHGPTTAGIKGLADKEMIFCAKSTCCYSTPSKLGFRFFFFFCGKIFSIIFSRQLQCQVCRRDFCNAE